MLMPKRTKYRKMMKGRMKGNTKGGGKLTFGAYGLQAVERGMVTARQIVLCSLALLPISLFPTLVGLAGTVYFYGALTLSLAFLVVAARAAWQRSPQSARALFRTTILKSGGASPTRSPTSNAHLPSCCTPW